MSGGDVQDTLNELERRLRELQAELSAQPRAPEPPAPPPPPPPPAPPAPNPLQDQLDELLRFRDQLADAAQKLVEDYSRLLEQINLASGRAAAPAQAPPTTAAGHVTFPVPPPTAPSPESALHAGEVTIEAAPFEDIASVAAFEEAVRSVPHAEDVVVRSFDEGRAVVGLRLAAEIPLVFELRRASDQAFDVEHAEGGRLVLAMHSADLPFPARP